MVLADIIGAIYLTAAIAGIIVCVVVIAPGGRKVVARVWTWWRAPRRQLAEQRSEIGDLNVQVATLRQTADHVRTLYDNLNVMSGLLAQTTRQLNELQVAHNQEVADRKALQDEVQRLATHIVALNARVDTPAGARPGVMPVAEYIKQITPRSTEELMEQQSRETGNREPPA